VLLAFAFALGACIGSFLNVCVGRWPLEQSVVSPPSRCPNCNTPIRARDNIPIVGWLLLRGRCRDCAAPISAQYPIVELLVGLGWLAAAASFGAGFTALRVALIGTVLFGIALTDAKHYLIPDELTVIPFLWVLVTSVVAAWRGDASMFAGPWDALIGACVGAGAISIAGWLGEYFLKKEAMGFGDVTLMALVGAAVGPGRALLVIFVGAAIGAVSFLAIVYPMVRLRAARRAHPRLATTTGATDLQGETGGTNGDVEMPQVPFGVFLAPAALVTLLWGQRLIEWYVRRMQTL
jgi:leader peptidase (prepilin peptidase)/N-methyltransferase